MNDEYYKGKVVPSMIQEGKEATCDNAYCAGISCYDCIYFPIGIVKEVLSEYTLDKNKDRYNEL